MLRRLYRALQAVSEWTGRAIAWLTAFMVLVTFAIVVLRYAFNVGWIAMQESVLYMHAMVFLLGAAYTLKHEGHVRVDIFYRKLGPRGQAWVDLIGTLVFLFPLSVFIIWTSWDYVASSWALKEGSREAGGLPWVYLLKTVMPLMAVLLCVEGLAQVLRNILTLRGQGPDHPRSEVEV